MIWHQKEVMVSALAEQGRICQLHIFHEKEKRILGNIYIGKVQQMEFPVIILWVKNQKFFSQTRKKIRP